MVKRATMWCNIRIVSLANVVTSSTGNECKILMLMLYGVNATWVV